MKKEIIGWKLKTEFEHLEKLAARIYTATNPKTALKISKLSMDLDGYWFMNDSNAADMLRAAGVLEVWFEPVYKEETEFKVGDWVIWDYKNEVLRHATPEEVKAHLLTEAKRRYPVGTKVKCLSSLSVFTVKDTNYWDDEDVKVFTDEKTIWFRAKETWPVHVYQDGKWAEIITTRKPEEILADIWKLLKELKEAL